MTKPCPETLEREKDKHYLTQAELIRRLGWPEKRAKLILRQMVAKKGFPQPQALIGGRYYWPAVRAYLDRLNGLRLDAPQDRRESHG